MAEPWHMFVVDDETDLANVVGGYLRRKGSPWTFAQKGQARWLRREPGRPT